MKEKSHIEAMEYRNQAAYPEIKVLSQNGYYANLLLEEYAGKASEMTSVNQLMYHARVNDTVDQVVANHLLQLAKVEQFHSQILGTIIYLLGTYPVFRSGDSSGGTYWSGNYVSYGRSLYEQLQKDLELKYQLIKNYCMHICLIKDPFIKKVLERIVLDEEVQVNVITKLMEEYNK